MKNKIQDPELFKAIKVFLTSYLPHIKKCSKHTVEVLNSVELTGQLG